MYSGVRYRAGRPRGELKGGKRDLSLSLFLLSQVRNPTIVEGARKRGENRRKYTALCSANGCYVSNLNRERERGPLKRTRIQLPGVAYLLSCHKTRHCPSRRYHLCCSTRSHSFGLYTHLGLLFSLSFSFGFFSFSTSRCSLSSS